MAGEQGWNHAETIESLIRKSGHRPKSGPALDQQVRDSIMVQRYQSSKAVLTYAEYIAFDTARA